MWITLGPLGGKTGPCGFSGLLVALASPGRSLKLISLKFLKLV